MKEGNEKLTKGALKKQYFLQDFAQKYIGCKTLKFNQSIE